MLSELDRAVLAFEERHPAHTPAKVTYMRDTFAISPARYYQRLVRLASNPRAVAEYPQTVKRIHRLLMKRLQARH